MRRHAETAGLVVPPPPCESRQLVISRVAFVDETSGDAAGTTIEIFVAAPDRKIHVPIVQLERQISGGVCHVKAHDAALFRAPARVMREKSKAWPV